MGRSAQYGVTRNKYAAGALERLQKLPIVPYERCNLCVFRPRRGVQQAMEITMQGTVYRW